MPNIFIEYVFHPVLYEYAKKWFYEKSAVSPLLRQALDMISTHHGSGTETETVSGRVSSPGLSGVQP